MSGAAFFKEIIPVHAVWVALQGKGAALEVGEDVWSDGTVIFQDLGFGETRGRVEDFVQVGQGKAAVVYFYYCLVCFQGCAPSRCVRDSKVEI